jgi:hypothetical protein
MYARVGIANSLQTKAIETSVWTLREFQHRTCASLAVIAAVNELLPIAVFGFNLNTAIRGGRVGAALAVVRHGGLQRLYLKIPPKSRPALQRQWLR